MPPGSRPPGSPQVKTLDDFDFTFQRSIDRKTIQHQGRAVVPARSPQRDLPRPTRTGKTHLSIALGVQAARRGHRVAFATAHDCVQKLTAANRRGELDKELTRLGRTPLLVIDEVGYVPFNPDAAVLLFTLISSRYERALMIVNCNKTFSAWTEIFGDAVAVTAMVDRLVHHADVHVLRGDSYRLKDKSARARLDPS